MSLKRIVSAVLVAAAVAAAIAVGMPALFTEAEAGPCICPKIYAPVICDNGRTYSNQCLADCRNAKNCVPTGEL